MAKTYTEYENEFSTAQVNNKVIDPTLKILELLAKIEENTRK